MTFKENKCKYVDNEEEVSMETSKKRWTFGNNDGDNGDDNSSEEEVSSEEEPAR
jgi:hypothetical protein